MSRGLHYVPVFQHHEGKGMCVGHAKAAFLKKADAAAAAADVLELDEREEVLLLEDISVKKPAHGEQEQDITVTLRRCDCKCDGPETCDIVKELGPDSEDDEEEDYSHV